MENGTASQICNTCPCLGAQRTGSSALPQRAGCGIIKRRRLMELAIYVAVSFRQQVYIGYSLHVACRHSNESVQKVHDLPACSLCPA